MFKKHLLLFLLIVVGFTACHHKAVPESSVASSKGKAGSQTGMASYYADKFNGRPTASGEKYRSNDFTAAHRTLPFGTRVTVTNLKNGKSVTVRVNDRGPFAKGRIIDLSKAAAKQIDMIGAGVAKVKIRYKY